VRDSIAMADRPSPRSTKVAAARRGRTPWPWIVGAGVVLAALVLAVAVSAGTDDDGDGGDLAQTGSVRIAGEPLPPHGDDARDAAVGRVAPTLDGSSFDGTGVTVGPGRPTLVLFLAHWCPHCQREVPLLVDHFADEGLPEGVDLVAVATGTSADRPNYPPSQWLEDEGWTSPVLLDSAESEAAAAYGLSAYPYLVALDDDGRVVARVSGEFSGADFDRLVALAGG
jgi:cytochrome c biogenesis protein CcmG/thiol:disulfide interchange protein DsbE